MRKQRLFVWFGLVFLALLTGCQSPVSTEGGTLTITLGDGVSRLLSPTVSMVPASYELTGTGPQGATFAATVAAGSSITRTALAFGDWTVSATAKNAAGGAIGVGSGTATVHSNTTAALAITVRPFAGVGALNLSLDWTASKVDLPQVVASLTPSTGSARPLNFVVDAPNGNATLSATDVPTGYHTLSLQLKDNGILTMGAVEVVRVVKDQTTTGAYHFTNLNQATGAIQVNITPDLADPLTVTLGGGAATKPANQALTLSASVAESGVNATYVWYANGDIVGTGPAWTLNDTWAQGYYRIDVTAFSADGRRAGSASYQTQVTAPVPNALVAVAGSDRSMVLKGDGTLWASGYNYWGQLGDGTTIQRNSPVQVMTGVTSMVAGGSHSLALKGGVLWSFGNNNYGALGDGSTNQSLIPVQVMTGVSSVAAGNYHSLALKTDGTLWTFGGDYSGQLGDGTTIQRQTPVQVMTDVRAMAAGNNFSLALKLDGTLWAFGKNAYGELGDGTKIQRNSPVQIMTGVASIAANYYRSFAVKTDGTLWAFGSNANGQLGDGTATDRLVPTQVMTGVASVAAGSMHSLVVKTDGTLWTFGYNLRGQLGDGTTTERRTPAQVMTGVLSATAGGEHSLVVKTDGTLWGFGENSNGQLGDGTTTRYSSPIQLSGWSN